MSAPKMELRRPKEAEPIEPGYYYARLKDNENGNVFPVYVGYDGIHKLSIFAGSVLIPLHEYNWFGPVPTCVESGS